LSLKEHVASLDDKRGFILENETQLAKYIARKLIDRPELSIWMIVIPVFFVYFFYQLNRSSSSRKEFALQFVSTRKLILNEAYSASTDGEKPDFQEMAEFENVPDDAKEAYRGWAKVLFEHYQKLLTEDGNSYAELVRGRYENRGRYLTILDQMTKTENRFYKALRKELNDTVKGSGDVISTIEKLLSPLRHEEANTVFSAAAAT
jgi:hypothetical protein